MELGCICLLLANTSRRIWNHDHDSTMTNRCFAKVVTVRLRTVHASRGMQHLSLADPPYALCKGLDVGEHAGHEIRLGLASLVEARFYTIDDG